MRRLEKNNGTKMSGELIGINRRNSYCFYLGFIRSLLLSVFICVHLWFHSSASTCEAATGLDGHAAVAAEGAICGVITIDL